MSEFWKSTPRYWCKFCKTYIKDTKFEKQNHEATGKHQGNVRRSINQLNRDQSREERDKERAKAEVARLNAAVEGKPPPRSTKHDRDARPTAASQSTKIGAEEQKQRMNQLASMGVAIPDEYRGDMALAGGWQTISVRRVGVENEDGETKPDPVSIGVHKRKLDADADDDSDDDHTNYQRKSKPWGSSYNNPARSGGEEVDFDALIGRKDAKPEIKPEIKEEPVDDGGDVNLQPTDDSSTAMSDRVIKQEPSDEDHSQISPEIKQEPSAVLFKKRKKIRV